uniref:SRCR domain-containing protein n=1 Tax=Seriola lalandi dorsalis TaxID=1841481 RepID=A0A3B4XWL4_SERLL
MRKTEHTDNLFCVLSVMPDDIRLVGGANRCAGRLEMKKQGNWTPVNNQYKDLKRAAAVLVNGTDLCSGRLEVRSNLSWSSVCEDDFDRQDAEVVCRELGCGAPSAFQGALYGEVESPVWTEEFQCEGNESVLLDCNSFRTVRKTCLSGKAVGLTCAGRVRLVGGANYCTGRLELKHHEEWRKVSNLDFDWNLEATATICRWLDCGSSASTKRTEDSFKQPVWWLNSSCVQSKYKLKQCVAVGNKMTYSRLEITCSGKTINGAYTNSNVTVLHATHGVKPAQTDRKTEEREGLRYLLRLVLL